MSFDSQGGSTPSPTAITVTHGSTYGLLATTTRAGYGFSGWWTGPGGTGEEVTSTTPVTITASQTLYAKWTVNTYTVSFDAQGGTAPSPATVSVTSGSTYGLLASTARVGYTFAGWWTGPGGTGAEVTPTTPVTITADQTLYAKWTANTYTVSFNAQGGTAPSPATTTVTYGGTYGPLATTIRTGYAFGGWWTGPGGTGAEVISTTQVAITANQTLYAKWTVNTYTVSFDAQGGSTPSPATTTVTYGGTYGALATTTRTGYAFNGWWTSPGGTGAEVTSTSQVTITTNQTLYAKWTASTYTVSFDSQGGSTPSPTTTTVTYEGTYGSLATTMRAGYTFGGWWTGPGGTGAEVISTTQVAITANQTLYAKWTVNTYTVSFDAQGGSTPSPATTTVTYGGTYGALATTTRAGYGFAGWWTGPGGTGAEVTPTTPVTITADQTLYAKWTANTYTVSFDAQGGTAPSPTTVNVTSGSTYGPLATTTREGYTFAGWWTGPGGVGVQVTAAMSVTITDNQTLYAKWTATTYTVGFDAQGGTAPSPAATTVIYGAAYGPLASTTRPGYTFGGWWTSPGGAGDEVMSSTLVSITDDQTLYAKWTANTYTVTFDAQGGADPSPETTEVTYGATYGPLATTTRTGYIFAGWWTLPDGEGQEVTPLTPVMIADNQTLYAKWTQDSLRVIPDDGLTTAGSTGGPFVPPGKQYTLVNEGSSSLTWNAACPSNWVYVAPSTGTLPAGGTNLVTVSISSNTLGAGVHDAAVTFSNVTAGIISAARPVNLTVSASGEGVLTTTFAGGNGYAGNMFDIIPKANLEITALDVNISPTGAVTTVSVYYRQGSSFGFENSSAGWTLLATQNVSSAGEDMPTHVNLTGNDRVLAVGETYGFYVYINYGSGIEMHYSNGSNTYENADLTLISNCGKGSPPFVGGTYSPRTWNGTIYYDTRVGRHLNVVLPEEVTEGDGVLAGQGSVIITPAPGTNLAVSLTSSDTGEALVPTSVMVPAGQTNVVFDITVVDDGELDGTQMATINASAAGYIDGSATVAVHDNETASLAVTLPPSATEGDVAVQGQVRVSAAVGSDVGVSLGSSDTSELTVPATVVIPAGQTSAVFTAAVINDGQIDGPQPVIVTAHVEGWTDGTAPITVLDDETVNLTLVVPAAASEGSGVLTNAGRMGIGGTLGTDLIVSLSSGDTSELVVPASVTIAAGATNATFNVTIVDDAATDGAVAVTVSASAGGFNGASAQTTVRDNDLHHFGWAAISSPKDAGIPFGVVLSALDVNSATIGVWSGTATLGGAGDGGAVTISPASTTVFTNGVWSGSLRVNAPDTNVRLTASDGAGHTGQSNPFDVQVAPLDHFVWSPIGATQFVGAPFAVNIAAQDAASNIVTSFTGTVALATCSDTKRGIGTGTNRWNYPLSTFYHDARTQVIYLRDELGGPTRLRSLGLDVATVPGQTMTNFTIRLKHTGVTNYSYLSRAWETDNWTVVYRASQTISTTGWVDIPFSTNFEYNGVSNLLVDISFNNSGYTTDGYCRYTPTATSRSIYYRTDSGCGDPLNWVGTSNPAPYLLAGIPNVRLSAGEGGGVPIVPTNSGNFAGGVWSGTIAVLEAGTNIAVVAADSVGHSGTSTVFTVEGFSDLAVVMGDAPDPVMAGSNLTYSVTITNGGPDSASLVVLTDPLSANFTFISASASQGTCTQVAGIVTCGLGTISNGAGATATIVVIPKISGTLTNSVTVSAAGTDPNPTNNTATVATAVEGVGILAVTPPEGLSFAGPLGGPFTPSNQVYLLSNIGAATLNWSAAHGANWVSLSAQSGMLVPSATAAVTVSVNSAAATLPVGEHADSITFSNLTGIGGGFVRDVNLTVNTPAPVLYGFPLDVDPGWTRQGEWAFGRPTGQGGAGFGGPDPSSGATGSNVFGVNLKGDYSTSVGGPYYLTAGPINFVGVTSIQLQFRRWLNSDYQPFVSATLDVSTNGSAWTAIWSNASTAIEESDWNTVRYDLPAWVNNRSNVYVRWGYRIASGAFAYSGWNIDDIQFLGAPTNHLVVAVPAVAFEGDGVLAGQGSVMITPAPGTNLAVTLTSSDTGEALVPTSVMVPAGQTNIVFDITVVDDGELDGTQMANISASAAGYIDGSATVAVHDNEAASLAVTLPPNATEGDVAVQGRVRVSAAVGSDVGVSLGSSDTSELTVPATVVIPAGQTSAVFTAAVINDGQIDGPQPVIVTAHVEGWTDGTAPITVLDDETVNLTLALPVAASEGSGVLTNAGRVGIGGTLGGDLVVSLSSGDTTELAVPGSVTISAGLTNATFNVTIVDDAENDGAVSVTVNASAGGFNGASAQTTVRDNDLHHFGWAAISSPKDAGIPFGVVLSALDVNSATIGVWSGTATLGGAGDGGAVTISPASTTVFTNGVWSGSLRVNAPDTNVRLTASDGAGHTGQSNPFDVQVAPLDHFVWSPIGATQFVGAPFAVNIAAQDAASNIVTSFTGTVALAARSVAQRAIGTGTNKWNCPLSTYFHDTRTQVIYLRDELGGAMCLTSVGLDVATVPGQTMTNLTIRLKHTGLTNYISGAWETDNWTMVYRANRAISTTGWVDIPFSTNFEYNGVSNLLVDISFNNSGYTTDGYCRYTPTTASRSIYYRTDSGFGDPLNWVGTSNPTPYLFAGIPNVRFTTGGGGGVPIIPTNSGGFVNGIWTGTVTALEGGAAVVLVANDGTGHSGTGNVFTVTAASDLGVAVMAASDPVWVGSNLFYSVSVTNLGPGVATGVVVSNSLPGDVVFGSAFASQGSWVNVTGIVVWSLGTLSNDQFATLNMNVTPVAAGLVTNRATLSALEPDPLPSNNIAFTFTTVLCDTDGDGIDDAYEDANGLDRNDPTDGPLDPDGDGLSNLEEYWADTDPRDRASCFTIAAFNWINGEAVIRFHVSANRTYRVEYSSDLVNWIELPGSIISGTEGIAEIIDGNAAIQPMRFYRARVQR
ncbi:MAG TPA: InlB B-repeat-containing protein [Verrucomicrobiae bacterium]|nr:InlB B-repeat-containing protein [Verrucomicrobiae bacterium]